MSVSESDSARCCQRGVGLRFNLPGRLLAPELRVTHCLEGRRWLHAGGVGLMARYWPLGAGRIVTSPFGPREDGFHAGTDFGFPGGSANKPVYACASGIVI